MTPLSLQYRAQQAQRLRAEIATEPEPEITMDQVRAMVASAILRAGAKRRNELDHEAKTAPPPRGQVQATALGIVNAARKARGQPLLRRLP
jgi:hypothetical protein